MNKKGFTLIEVIAIIAILGVIMTLVGPRLIDMLNGGIEKTMKVQENEVKESGLIYLEDYCKNSDSGEVCPSSITLDENTYTYSGKITLEELLSTDIMDGDVKLNGTKCTGCVVFNNNDATAYLKCGTTYETPNYSTKCN